MGSAACGLAMVPSLKYLINENEVKYSASVIAVMQCDSAFCVLLDSLPILIAFTFLIKGLVFATDGDY